MKKYIISIIVFLFYVACLSSENRLTMNMSYIQGRGLVQLITSFRTRPLPYNRKQMTLKICCLGRHFSCNLRIVFRMVSEENAT